MRSSPRTLLLAIGCVFFAANSPAWDADWEPLRYFDQFEMGRKTFTLIEIRPTNIRQLVESVAPDQRSYLVHALWHQRAETTGILHDARDFILGLSLDSEMVTGDKRETLIAHFQKLLSGEFPLMLVTQYQFPSVIYQVVGVGPDSVTGIPLERRLVGRGMEMLPRPQPTTGPFPVCYVHPHGRPECDQNISDFLSKVPRVYGAVREARSLTKDPQSPYDFSELLFWRSVARGWFWEGDVPLPVEKRAPALVGEMLEQALELKQRHPKIPNGLIFPEQQERLFVSAMYAHTLTASRELLYSRKFGTAEAVKPFIDPDYNPRLAHIIELPLRQWMTDRKAPFFHGPDHQEISFGVSCQNSLGAFAQAASSSIRGVASTIRPGLLQKVWDVRRYTVPKGRYLDQMYRQYFR